MSLVVEQVAGSDSGLIAALAGANLPVEDLFEDGRSFFRFAEDGRTIGFGGFEPHGAYALVRSIVVLPEARGMGLGRKVAERLLSRAEESGCSEVFLLTTTAAGFFEHLGFRRIDRADAPEVILGTRQAATICSTATMLARALNA